MIYSEIAHIQPIYGKENKKALEGLLKQLRELRGFDVVEIGSILYICVKVEEK